MQLNYKLNIHHLFNFKTLCLYMYIYMCMYITSLTQIPNYTRSLNDLLQASPDEDEKKVLKKVLDKLLEVQVQRILRNVLTFNYQSFQSPQLGFFGKFWFPFIPQIQTCKIGFLLFCTPNFGAIFLCKTCIILVFHIDITVKTPLATI